MKILFVGNSFTARNDVPALIAALAAAFGERVEHELISAGGASLRAHWNAGRAIDAIRRERRDYVVLQEQSTLPLKNPKRMHENVRLFAAPIAESGARAALYATWARRTAPGTQEPITAAYTTIAAEIGATLVPVGTAWQAFTGAGRSLDLYDRDSSHPSPAGSYLAACVFVAVLFGRSPAGLPVPVPGISPADAASLQEAAWQTVSSGGHGRNRLNDEGAA